jgi:hypothetical protein
MNDPDLNALAEKWLAYVRAPESQRANPVQEWSLVREKPELAWQLILEILRRDNSSGVLEDLSAGLLEDLLVYHGKAMIDRVEAEARSNPLFAKLLGGVWQNEMPDHIWRRVQAVWDRRGWDGIPEDH